MDHFFIPLISEYYIVVQKENVEKVIAVACGHYTRLYKKTPLYYRNSL